ncbi:MAG TPA: protein kinase [Bryobacteraceae bacterium]|jgi:serine/threonine-protein kinase|nr:protein kinase [Bryobacteraceae bacterium]
MTGTQVINGRYEVKDPPIGQGGMGVVYRAYDVITKRNVALKTMRGVVETGAIELFEREWTVLARLSHPNIVDILDTGEFAEDGQRRPYFVMPLLPGATLDSLIKSSSHRLTVERTVEIMTQACRGLQAAHDQGLVHRDLKPSNIFVMDDDTVKIIDFGVVHLADTRSVTGIKGTLQYMAPEQLEMKPASPLSDIFSLGVVCYETLTGRKPFSRKTEGEVADAIRTYIPPPASDINAAVNQLLSRTIHKAMAKQPWHRFSNARELADTLQKALRNEPIERFDRGKIQPRIDRIRKAFGEGDTQFALEILTELESEGHIDPDMPVLRIQIEQAVRQKTIRQLIESARTRVEEEEYPLALQKVQDVLNIDPSNADALSIRALIERHRSEKQVDNWFRLVREHLDNQSYTQARQCVQEILKINSSDTRAREVLSEIDRTEQEFIQIREEKQKLYQGALQSYQNGEISSALSKLERVLEFSRRSPKSATPDRDAQYQSLYNQIRSERDAAKNSYAEAVKNLADKNFARVLQICEEFLKNHAGDPMFQALKIEAEELQRQEHSAAIADVNRRAEQEPDLDKRLAMIKEAVEKFPNEPHFKQSLKLVRDRRDLVNSIVARARQYEERAQFNDAMGQWDILRSIYAQYPGLDFEVQRLARRREDQSKAESRSRWIEKVDRHLAAAEYTKAGEVVKEALIEFPEDKELIGLAQLAEQATKRGTEAAVLLAQGQAQCAERNYDAGLASLRKAALLDERNPSIRATLLTALLEHARALMTQDWHSAEPLIQQALEIDGSDPIAKSLSSLVQDYRRQEVVSQFILEARGLQATGNLEAALNKAEEGIRVYPNELRLSQLHATLRTAVTESRKTKRSYEALSRQPSTPEPTVVAPPPPSPAPNAGPAAAPPKTSTVEASTPKLAAAPTGAAPAPTPFKPPPKPAPAENAPDPLGATMLMPAAALPIPKETVVASTPAVAPPVSLPPNPFKSPTGQAPVSPAATKSAPVVPPASTTKTPKPKPPVIKGEKPAKKFPVWLVAAAAVVVIGAALAYQFVVGRRPATAPVIPGQVAVNLSANVPHATFLVDGHFVTQPLKLTPGPHQVEARLDGYRTEIKSFTVPASASSPVAVSLVMQPALPGLQISSSLKTGKLVLDNGEPADLNDGSLTKEDIAVGDHTVKILDGSREVFSFSFHVAPKETAKLTSPLALKDTPGVVVSSLGSNAQVFATPGTKGAVNGQDLKPIPAEGVTLTGLTAGNTEFQVDDGKSKPHMVTFESFGAPMLSVWLSGAPEGVRVMMTSNVPDATVLVNDQPLKRPFADGKRVITLAPGKYRLKVSHADFQDSAEQIVEIKPGDTTAPGPLAFQLTPIVHKATLSVSAAPPDAEVLIDGVHAGTVTPAGTFTSDLTPAHHTITLRKPGFEEFATTRDVSAGESLRVSGDGLKPFGTLTFRVSPASSRILYQREGENGSHEVANGQTISLHAGNYEVTAEAGDRYASKSAPFIVVPGKGLQVDLILPEIPKPTPETRTPSNVFENPSAWTIGASSWWVHDAPGYSFLRENKGSFSFDILKQMQKGVFHKGPRKVMFVVDYHSDQDRILYTLEEHQLRRKVYAPSGDSSDKKVGHGMDDAPVYRVVVDLEPDRVIIRNRAGTQLDEVKRTSPGKFGFLDEVTLVLTSVK